jgi:D-alanyl-D-alanine carboxypeptidase
MRRFIFGILLVALVGTSAGLYFAAEPMKNNLPTMQDTALPTAAPEMEENSDAQHQGNLPLLVNGAHPLPEDYKPDELIRLYDRKERSFELAASDIKVGGQTFRAMQKMFLAAAEDGVEGFIITSGYRTRKRQRELYEERQDDTVQKPGCSEHESGLAFDVTARGGTGGFETTRQFQWLSQNCAEYGFILRYPQGKEQETGIAYEPWHYRYVGREAAREIMSRGITLETYCAEKGA